MTKPDLSTDDGLRAAIAFENLGNALYKNHSSDLCAPGRSVLATLELRDPIR